jgi:hypothetical protein
MGVRGPQHACGRAVPAAVSPQPAPTSGLLVAGVAAVGCQPAPIGRLWPGPARIVRPVSLEG